jgi:hypothetical protein
LARISILVAIAGLATGGVGHAQSRGVLQATVRVVDVRTSQWGNQQVRRALAGRPPTASSQAVLVRVDRPMRAHDAAAAGDGGRPPRPVRVTVAYY